MISTNKVKSRGAVLAALITPLVPPVIVCIGLISYTLLEVLSDNLGLGPRRVIDTAIFLAILTLIYGFVFSYTWMAVFFVPMHIVLRILGVGGYLLYCALGMLTARLFLSFGLTDPALRGGNMDSFYTLCGAVGGLVFWRLATGTIGDSAPHPFLERWRGSHARKGR
jgi:hypothetical protein